MIVCENLVKIYKVADLEVVALQGLDLVVQPAELMAIVGNSGSGKSTLLNILGGLDRPSAGRVTVAGRDMVKMSERGLVRYKREVVGFVWQQTARNLIPYLTALENVELPMMIAGRSGRKWTEWAKELLDAVGLADRMRHRLSALSGGEQQRVAIAIGLANRPRLLLADEPTGSVDTATGNRIFDMFRELRDAYGTTTIIVTHDISVMAKVERTVAIRDGRTSSELIRRVRVEDVQQVDGRSQVVLGETHEEFTVLDPAGRLQIPRDYIERLGLRGKVKVDFDGEQIIVRPADEA
ncbi:MAG: ABC transporter ATP-binding protein [Chloroflexi bacterium]|nr:ABC transporter ATP-binding protein [Chloroflexota bacterium]